MLATNKQQESQLQTVPRISLVCRWKIDKANSYRSRSGASRANSSELVWAQFKRASLSGDCSPIFATFPASHWLTGLVTVASNNCIDNPHSSKIPIAVYVDKICWRQEKHARTRELETGLFLPTVAIMNTSTFARVHLLCVGHILPSNSCMHDFQSSEMLITVYVDILCWRQEEHARTCELETELFFLTVAKTNTSTFCTPHVDLFYG